MTPKHSIFSSPDWTHSAILKLLFFFKHFNCFLLCVCLMCDGACMCCGIHVRENFVELVFPLHLYVGTRIGHKLSGLSGNSNLAQNFISWLKMTLPIPTKQKSRTSFKSLFPSFSLSSHQVIFILPVSPFTWPLECNTHGLAFQDLSVSTSKLFIPLAFSLLPFPSRYSFNWTAFPSPTEVWTLSQFYCFTLWFMFIYATPA